MVFALNTPLQKQHYFSRRLNMLTIVASNNTETVKTTQVQNEMKGEELLLSYLLWENKFEGDAHDTFEDPIDVFLTSQGEKPLSLA